MAHHTLRNHRKLKRLAREIPDCPISKLVGHLQLLWWDVYETTAVLSDGKLVGWTIDDIEAVCEWEGESGILAQALIVAEFIDVTDGTYSVHDYATWAPDYVKKRWKRLSECPDNGGQRQISAANGGQRLPTQRNPTQRNPTKPKTIAADKPPRTRKANPVRDPIWEALAKQFYPNGIPPGQESFIGKCVTDLVAMKAKPDDVAVRAVNYVSQMPDCVLTMRALVNNWELCRDPKQNRELGRIRTNPNRYAALTARAAAEARAFAERGASADAAQQTFPIGDAEPGKDTGPAA